MRRERVEHALLKMPGGPAVWRTKQWLWRQGFRLLGRQMYREREFRSRFFQDAIKYVQFNGIPGDYAEFGCHTASTFSLAYRWLRFQKLDRKLWAFDSFSGLPPSDLPQDRHSEWFEGNLVTGLDRFHLLCRGHGIPRERYEVVPGWYEQTLAPEHDTHLPRTIALAYVDCDLYSSTRTVLQFLLPRLQQGMVLAFDDYYCYTTTAVAGERAALCDLLHDHPQWRLVPFIRFGPHGMSFVVENREHLPSGAGEF